jgi:phosphoglycolate phosphatase
MQSAVIVGDFAGFGKLLVSLAERTALEPHMRNTTLLIDFDGTLCDSKPAIQAAFRAQFPDAGNGIEPAERLLSLIGAGHSIQNSLAEVGISQADIPGLVGQYRKRYAQYEHLAVLYPGVMPTLKELKRRGHRLLLLSNKGQSAVLRAMQHLQISVFFDAVLAEVPDLPSKPDAAVFSQRIAPLQADLQASECLMIGDTETDLQFAHNIGAKSAFAAYGYGDDARCKALGYAYHLESFTDLLSL